MVGIGGLGDEADAGVLDDGLDGDLNTPKADFPEVSEALWRIASAIVSATKWHDRKAPYRIGGRVSGAALD
jgi:hypothetical protein